MADRTYRSTAKYGTQVGRSARQSARVTEVKARQRNMAAAESSTTAAQATFMAVTKSNPIRCRILEIVNHRWVEEEERLACPAAEIGSPTRQHHRA